MTLRCFLALLLALPVLHASAAAPAEAEQRLHSGVDEAIRIAMGASSRSALVERLRPLLENRISFPVMTRRAVGPGWRQFSAAQQQKATQLFTTLIIRSYSNKFTIGEKMEVKYLAPTNPAAGRVDVPTTLTYQGSRYAVTYRMEQEEGWKVTDVVIEGVSLVATYRSQLDAQFKKGGADAVVSSLSQSVSRPQ